MTVAQENINRYLPFLLEVRRRVLFLASAFIAFSILGFTLYEKIVAVILSVFSIKGVNIVFTSPFQFINLAFSVGFSVGIISIVPLVILQFLSFLKPALKKKEYKIVVSLLPLSLILFVAGFTFGALIMKWQMQIFLGRSENLGIGNILDIGKLLSVIIVTSSLMGLGFEFPIVFSALIRLRVIKYNWLEKQRPWAYLISFIFALLLPPDSVLADVVLTLPLVFLYEVTLILNKVFYKHSG